jgi:porin
MVYQVKPGSDKGLVLWTTCGYYPQDNISVMPFQTNIGAIYKGLFPGRDEDREIFGIIYGRFSRQYAHSVEAAGNGNPEYEMVLEASHRFQFTKFAWLQPDIQYVIRPSGTGHIPNAVVIGAEWGITF